MSLYLGTNLISGVATPIEGARNIGQIVQSTIPLTDAGLHLLDGALIQGSGSYADFVDYIASIVNNTPDIFTTEASWQQSVTDYGVCGKFVYDSVNNTVRLPKYNSKIYSGGGIANAKGNGISIGLTDSVNNQALFVDSNFNYLASVGSYGLPVGSDVQGGSIRRGSLGLTTDSTKSGIITDLSTITTALDGYWYIVIATSTKTDIQVDIDEIATDLNGKADVDLSNITTGAFENVVATAQASEKSIVVGWGMPDYSAGVSLGNSGTFQKNGYVLITRTSGNNGDKHILKNNDVVVSSYNTSGNGYTHYKVIQCLVLAGTYEFTHSGTTGVFYPCIGG